MKELIERLAAIERPDPELGRAVLLACGWRKTQVGYFLGPLWHWSSPDGKTTFPDDNFFWNDPTRSLDAALKLVPEGWTRSVDATVPCMGICVDLYAPKHEVGKRGIIGDHVIEAVATCIAALQARSVLLAKET